MVFGLALMGARRTDGGMSCGYATGGRTYRFGSSAATRLHESLTDSNTQGVFGGASVALQLDSSSRFYVFDQDTASATREFGAAVGRACVDDPATFNRAVVTWCPPLANNGIPPAQCTRSGPGTVRDMDAIFPYCLVSGGQAPVSTQCPGDSCGGNCRLLIPGECLTFNTGLVGGAVRMVTARYDRSVPIQWARLPYTGDVSGPEETVALVTPAGAPWGHTPRSVRNYDLGTCGAFVTWAQLATLINGAFFPVYARAIFSRPNSDATALLVNHADHLLSELRVGPVLRGRGFLHDDRVGLWFRTAADLDVVKFTFGQNVTPFANVFSRVQLYVQTDAQGYRRLAVDAPFSPALSSDSEQLSPNLSASIADGLRGSATAPGLAQILADTVNQGFLQPYPLSGTTSFVRCGTANVSTPAGVTECTTAVLIDPLVSGPEFGCYAESAFPTSLAQQLASDPTRTKEIAGTCATRLQPRRINVLPDELEIVLTERDDVAVPGSPGLASRREMREYLRFVLNSGGAGMSMGGASLRLSCDDRPDWNPVSVPGRIAQSGTIAATANDVRRCDSESTCNALRNAPSP